MLGVEFSCYTLCTTYVDGKLEKPIMRGKTRVNFMFCQACMHIRVGVTYAEAEKMGKKHNEAEILDAWMISIVKGKLTTTLRAGVAPHFQIFHRKLLQINTVIWSRSSKAISFQSSDAAYSRESVYICISHK